MSEDEALSEPFRLAEAAFREFAEMTAANEGGTFEQAHKATWRLFECGFLKLVNEGDRLRVRACITQAERRAAAKGNRPLAAYRQRMARWSQTERERASRIEHTNPSNLIEVGPVGSGNDSRIAVDEMA